MKNKTKVWLVVGIIIVIGLFWWSKALQNNDPDLISKNGIHWHPEVEIFVGEERQEIPANLGLGAQHLPIHTHVEDASLGVIHLEFESLVKKDDVRLERFFSIWGKDISSFGSNPIMTVNGEINTEYGDYVMQDGDKIELRYQ